MQQQAGDFVAFLELVQPGLINKIITACGLQDQSSQHNTAANMILTADIGMLNYLASSTRPDIAFAVHQCARFITSLVVSTNWPFGGLFGISKLLLLVVTHSSLLSFSIWIVLLMQTLLVPGPLIRLKIRLLLSLGPVMLLPLLLALSYGAPSYNLKLLSVPLRQSTLLCHNLPEI
jgi:hypothetical protein